LAMKMPQAFQMAVEAPAEYEERIGPPGSDLRVERRVDQTAEMMGAGVRSHVFDKTMGIAFQQGNVPLDLGSEIGVVFQPGRRLLPGIEHTWIERGVRRQNAEPGCIVLNGVRTDDRQSLLVARHANPFFSSQ